jgi:hypothetical protein
MSLPYDANQRTSSLSKAISEVKSNVVFKGFMGPTIKDDVSLPSLGIHAARAAGVIVDELGKMRCPPGTPNANQFTDLQMTNCMVPSAETLAHAAAEALSSLLPSKEPSPVERAIGKLTDSSELAGLPKVDHATSAQIKEFNAEVLAKAPKWGHVDDEYIKKINDSGIYSGAAILTLEERQASRRARMAKKISNLRSMIESGAQTDESGFPFHRVIDPKTHEFILTHTDDEVIDAIEQTALTIAKARNPESSVWAKGVHLEAYLTNGYLPTSDGASNPDAKVGDFMTSLLGSRGQYEAGIGAENGSGVRPVYGFSRFTFWDDELKRITEEKNLKEGAEIFSTDHYLTIPGRGAGGIGGYEGAFAGDAIGYGDMEFVLHPEVADRTVIHHNDSLLNQGRGAAAVGSSDEELVESIIGHLSDSDMNDNINRLLRTHVTQDFVNWTRSSSNNEENLNPNGRYTESNILGGFTAQDIKEIKFDARRLFPEYKTRFNPDGIDGTELIQKIEDQHLSTEQLLAAGFTMGEIEVARAKIAGWKTKNAEGNQGKNQASAMESELSLNGLISAMEMERITTLVAEKAPHARLIFGSANGIDLSDPTKYAGGKAGDRITDIWGERMRVQLLKDVQREIQWAAAPPTPVGESVA